jgi:hypothetical protein
LQLWLTIADSSKIPGRWPDVGRNGYAPLSRVGNRIVRRRFTKLLKLDDLSLISADDRRGSKEARSIIWHGFVIRSHERLAVGHQ